MSQYNVGDEVCVKDLVITDITTYTDVVYISFGMVSVKTDQVVSPDCFKDPLDEAIVKAAILWRDVYGKFDLDSSVFAAHCLSLRDAVQAKLDSQKPRTVKDLLEKHQPYDDTEWGCTSCGPDITEDFFSDHQVNKLLEAGLLKEDNS